MGTVTSRHITMTHHVTERSNHTSTTTPVTPPLPGPTTTAWPRHNNATQRNEGRGKQHGQGHLKTWPNTPTQSARTRTRHDTQGVQVRPPSLFFFNLFYLYCLGYSRSPAQQYDDGDGHGTHATQKLLTKVSPIQHDDNDNDDDCRHPRQQLPMTTQLRDTRNAVSFFLLIDSTYII